MDATDGIRGCGAERAYGFTLLVWSTCSRVEAIVQVHIYTHTQLSIYAAYMFIHISTQTDSLTFWCEFWSKGGSDIFTIHINLV